MTIPAPPDRIFAPARTTAHWGGRRTRVEIDLDAIGANVEALVAQLKGSELMAVVKADGYGHGAAETARVALEHGAARLAVYTVDEGVALRRAGLQAPILVMGPPTPGEVRDLLAHDLTPTIWEIETARRLHEAGGDGRIRVEVKIDTGLMRAGVPTSEAGSFMRALRGLRSLEVEAVYTHFAQADEADLGPARAQLSTFKRLLKDLARDGISLGMCHSANSAATLSLPAAHLDMVRCGIALFGYNPCAIDHSGIPLRPALTWLSAVARVSQVPAGTGIGYGHAFRAPHPMTIALVPVGYGDGFMRSLGLGAGRVLVRGDWARVVGRVSMDQITVDVSAIPGVKVDDEVTIIGRQEERVQDAALLAADAGTIAYEVLCGIMPRVPRIYVRHGHALG